MVQKRRLLDSSGMEEMLRILRTQAEFAGIEVVTYCFLENHFHILALVDGREEVVEAIDDAELVRRFSALYGNLRSPSLGVDAVALQKALEENGEEAAALRTQMKARMGDAAVFMKEFKTRFTKWYNEHYHTVGTFWAERYRSVEVEEGSDAAKAMAAYIDLNGVKAGGADEPVSYRFCGYAEVCRRKDRAWSRYRLLWKGAPAEEAEWCWTRYRAILKAKWRSYGYDKSAQCT
ncbi:MAG: hypothetical protein JJT96_00635 [Opitutales bacterium]|nr:hypothetical protein [Opitutales bacterium]